MQTHKCGTCAFFDVQNDNRCTFRASSEHAMVTVSQELRGCQHWVTVESFEKRQDLAELEIDARALELKVVMSQFDNGLRSGSIAVPQMFPMRPR